MKFLLTRADIVAKFFVDCARYGLPDEIGPMHREVLFLIDGVGRFQLGVVMARRALREAGGDIGSVMFDWQTFIVGEVFSDLVWYRRNRLMGSKLARKLLAFRRDHHDTRIHMLAISGGAGISIFALEALRGRRLIETLVLACPAMSSTYNLAPALAATKRCYALTSHRDKVILGVGTRIFGTTDRRFEAAGGMVGFRIPTDLTPEETQAYRRMHEIRWTPELEPLGHPGGHAGWINPTLLRRHLVPMLHGNPLLPTHAVEPA